ncbi:uncharacterized protein MYCFIDRAFT_76882 [Pseudocercospora fijiensis CIRAD86]|uniref:NmrA-like domain-containing protein n=1 Tax=Pseudocercospora fijiensis (strain CIRAD86) TaxID=383855 RepID=N1QCM1_PSEFD|nr:uncharacterized protein MYCFIDRAFT_76882 [Pseudocercospora fijiensis CIRAD86]EME89537.1 hypothetical protein MYCFIDRAFT_76882 [Pseudocercospora fijiensis CIRAD86]
MSPKTIFLLGATGFVGSYVTELLAQEYPEHRLIALLRNVTPERTQGLRSLHPGVEILEGNLEDRELVAATAETVDIVIHVAHSDHEPSVSATLEGLTKRSAKGGELPIYLHMSGCGILADNARGEYVPPSKIKEWSDIDLDLNDCPSENTHLPTDKAIFAAGTREENRIRTIIVFPSLIYGIGKNRSRCGMWVPIFTELARKAGHAGTWGPGEVTQYAIHVRDVANVVILLLGAALDGKVKGGDDGLFFATTKEPNMSWKEINDVLGEILFKRGEVKESGSKPFPPEITEPLGDYGWSLLGSNGFARPDKLTAMGWKPEWTKKMPLRDVIYEMIEDGIDSYRTH